MRLWTRVYSVKNAREKNPMVMMGAKAAKEHSTGVLALG
ncbi:hypothetical protein MADA3029_940192 [Vibrio nigripulchritudo MADA3029]|nr:hypothetical protein VIBNIMADA3020_910189 [Vibrio nigripulchritudo MADA3020]CCN52472.1 hypothetical protein VIBNIMADA3021_1230189 [Vibrio nigripulchritudo MADA3021]CCN62300.1 hypothetical protein MADA3029_940192 [Vibrio nigripulchritudo MADA3029]